MNIFVGVKVDGGCAPSLQVISGHWFDLVFGTFLLQRTNGTPKTLRGGLWGREFQPVCGPSPQTHPATPSFAAARSVIGIRCYGFGALSFALLSHTLTAVVADAVPSVEDDGGRG